MPAPLSSSALELDTDDILESNDIDAFEAAAADIHGFDGTSEEQPPSEEPVVAKPASLLPPSVVPAAKNLAFEVVEIAAFDAVEVEGLTTRPTEPSPEPAPAPATIKAAPGNQTLRGGMESPVAALVPPAPNTSPLPLESVIVSEPAEAPAPERTLEMKGDALAQVAVATEKLDGAPEHTEVLVRSAMPAALQAGRSASALAVTAPAWANGRNPSAGHVAPQPAPRQAGPRPSSIAPVALDVGARAPAIPPAQMLPRPASSNTSGLVVGGFVLAALALVGVVGVGGYVASRALSAKPDAVVVSAAEGSPALGAQGSPAIAPSPPAAAPSPPAADPSPTPSAPGVDVSTLPSAPAPGPAAAPAPSPAAPRALVGSSARTASNPAQGSAGARVATPSAGAALPPPGAAAPLPPPAAPAPAPVAAASGTGVVRVDPDLRAVVVDGSYRRANDGVVTVTCGRHKVKAGMKEAQVVDVPCGGSVSL